MARSPEDSPLPEVIARPGVGGPISLNSPHTTSGLMPHRPPREGHP
jgi:hypothetical protein